MKQVATIILNGEPFLSYRPDSSRIISPTTIPSKVIQDIGEQIFGTGRPIGYHVPFNCATTEETEEHVFKTTAVGLSIEAGKLIETRRNERGEVVYSSFTYVDADRIQFDWIGVEDFRGNV